jgi:3,4-dihydroxy 2-butanone 4-phosphate synthase/GTP cyclohydrolase II
MKLAEYIEARGVKRIDFAKAIGVTPGYITSLCNGACWPSREIVQRIKKVTRGAVTANDFMSEGARAS